MIRRTQLRLTTAAAAGAALALIAGAAPATAHSVRAHNDTSHANRTVQVKQINQVADQSGRAKIRDRDLVNPWGLALGPTSPLWSANNGTNTATLYAGGRNGAAVTKVNLTVRIPFGAPTGEAFNDTKDFVVKRNGKGGPAVFIFVSEGGDVTAWNPNADPTNAIRVAHVNGAIYKGLAVLHTRSGPFLLATDFHNGRVDVFDKKFKKVHPPCSAFRDKKIPKGYAPFNVLTVPDRKDDRKDAKKKRSDDKVYVTYAKQDANREDDVAGPGFGFVDLFTRFGQKVQRIASRGTLNAPWGLTIAPKGFGKFTGRLLVGNFGDGRISAFDGAHFKGLLRNKWNKPIVIPGLWALLPGTATTGGVGTLWFSSGPDNEQHGLVGQLVPKSIKK